MKCRNIVVDDNNRMNIVWFGSYGKNETHKRSADTYVEGVDALISDVSQSLSCLQGELWYNIYAGLPLVEKYKSKAIIDSYICQVINDYDEVKYIESFTSTLNGRQYSCDISIYTIYGTLDISI